MFFYPFLIFMTFCQFNQKKLIYENPHGPTASIVLKEAQKQGIDSRLLFIRLYQENLWNSLSPEELQKWSRAESLKLKNSPEKPENRMDWLLLAARTSLDAYPERKESDFHLKLLLPQYIHYFNQGYTMILPDLEVIRLPGASDAEQINMRNLDLRYRRYLNTFRISQQSDNYIPGPESALQGKKDPLAPTIIHIKWCHDSTIQCFENLMHNENSATHFGIFGLGTSQKELIQFYDIQDDILGRPNEISVALVHSSPTSLPSQTGNIRWSDYVYLKKILSSMMKETYRKFLGKDWDESLKSHVFVDSPYPEKGLSFSLGWDQEIFNEVLDTKDLKDESQIHFENPKAGQYIPHGSVPISLYPDPEASLVELYDDSEGKNWTLVLRQDFYPGKDRLDIPFSFRYNEEHTIHTLRAISRNHHGDLLSTQWISFVLTP